LVSVPGQARGLGVRMELVEHFVDGLTVRA
jgi:hypothetical protein